MKQLSDCCKAEIKLTGSPEHKDAFACAKCGRIIGTPIKKQKPKELEWEKEFDKDFTGRVCDGQGEDNGDTRLEIKYFIQSILTQQRTDWEERFDDTFRNIVFDTTKGTTVSIKDFISNLLQQQIEDFKQTMANSNEWWNNKLRQQREEIIKEIEGIAGEKDKVVGLISISKMTRNAHRNQLRKQIRERLKQITNLKEK